MPSPTISLLLLALSTLTHAQPSNLPPPPPGLFTTSTRLLIHNTTVSHAWSALTNFPAYAIWNPFVRRAIVIAPLNLTPTAEQYPIVGFDLYLRNQIPPLPLPVDENTRDEVTNTQFAYERITAVDRERGRLAWKYMPEELLQAERWQAVSEVGDGVVLYESREVFAGALAGVLEVSMGEDLQKGFVAQGEGLKMLLEGGGEGGGVGKGLWREGIKGGREDCQEDERLEWFEVNGWNRED